MKDITECFEEITDSFINGNFSQMGEQFFDLSRWEQEEFVEWLIDSDCLSEEKTARILSMLLIYTVRASV